MDNDIKTMLVLGRHEVRDALEFADVIVFMHSGMAVNHVAAGYLAYRKAKEKGLGTEVRIL